ncbi:MAG TPA: M1 family aminopeptidase [Clostridia bacterium]|nr:M1 family aminopeptidase [Clostridia bacterium]
MALSLLSPARALQAPATVPATPGTGSGQVLTLYGELRKAPLDASQVYRVRELALDREDVHIFLTDGTLAFTGSIDGHVTGAFFEGEGEVLLRPPDHVERGSLGLFTGEGVLNEKFKDAYLRFNDETYQELRANLQPAEDAAQFIAKWDQPARSLSEMDALRLLSSFTSDFGNTEPRDRYLHARIGGERFGVFDIIYDTMADEQVTVWNLPGRASFLDLWMAFPARNARMGKTAARPIDPWKSSSAVSISNFKIAAELIPPQEIDAEAVLTMQVRNGGQRLLYLELSRYLQVKQAKVDGAVVEFLQNESIEGSQLARQGNDYVIIILPEALHPGQTLQVEIKYRGNVMAQAGAGLLYVGARGTWYPNRGMAMANFDLEFRWPAEWTLVATGRRVSLDKRGDLLVGRWVSDVPIPLAGFNLGQYTRKSSRAGNVAVESYATAGMEYGFKRQQKVVVVPRSQRGEMETAVVVPSLEVNPAYMGQGVADRSARAVTQFSEWFGPYPYSSLSLTQFPGNASQGWPTLIFLSGLVFLTSEEKANLKLDDYGRILYGQLMQDHETAHQWWGGAVSWAGYRDQWLVEALANYSALMLLEREHPQDFAKTMEYYRQELLTKSPNGKQYYEAGPVTLGLRLSSSQFPDGYITISYGRGTWLFHMLRYMMRDAVAASPQTRGVSGDELFLRALRTIRERYARKQMTTRGVLAIFEEQLPTSLRFEGKKSLEWFMDGWINGSAIPRLSLDDVKISSKTGSAFATFTLKQENAPEELVTSVPIYAVLGDNRQVFASRVFADGSQTKLRVAVPPGTRRLVLDPHQTVLTRK